MSNCVHIHSPEFQKLSDETNVGQAKLKQIVH